MRKHQDFLKEDKSPYSHMHRIPSPEEHFLSRPKSQTSLPLMDKPKKDKRLVLQPGTPCQPLEEIIGCTKIVENNITTYLLSKALRGPLLTLASQAKLPPTPNSSKEIPKTEQPICGELLPHLPSYAVTTHEGIFRPENQDKVCVVLDKEAKWFGIYDGHGGQNCSQFLKEHLHQTFFNNSRWRQDPKQVLKETFNEVDQMWLETGDKAGSCCLVVLIVDDICYVANLGDSRALLASEAGHTVYQITKDHKPNSPDEQKRVLEAGGKIYMTTAITQGCGVLEHVVGPLRVYPGRLSTTRTFGDIEAKDPRTDGNPNVVISQPEITSFSISEHNFIIMASDGLWDRIQNKECLKIAKDCLQEGIDATEFCSRTCNNLLKEAMTKGSSDNISVTIIGLPSLDSFLDPEKSEPVQLRTSKHIKVVNSISNSNLALSKKKKANFNKQNQPSSKLKQLDSRINEITQSVQKLRGSK